ncbi:DUF1161 domain-containing protein [Phytobacter sp. V91]|uniref:DUF1161 domain-containing protein n=1 Tax=Phytobacter sp. V91 TaxID=3369425 RepID=UPI003F64727D
MRYVFCSGPLLLLFSASVFAAPDSCERVKSDIQQKIINNGVAESDFTLTIEPNDQNSPSEAQVVGHCANDDWKILYSRSGSGHSQAAEISSPANVESSSQ